jgi:hypothetical protein
MTCVTNTMYVILVVATAAPVMIAMVRSATSAPFLTVSVSYDADADAERRASDAERGALANKKYGRSLSAVPPR